MVTRLTDKTIRQFIQEVSDQHYALSGAVIAASAAQAAALGETCMQISLDNQVDRLDWQDVTSRIEQMLHLKNALIEWCDQDANSVAEYMSLQEAGVELSGWRVLCESPAEISRLSIDGLKLLQDFRPLVLERVQNDLELAINLLAGSARAAMLLLDSNLHIWPTPALLQEFEPVLANLEQQMNLL
jgi:formiminotetrahydrofolate cyclodeaminase